MTKLTQVAIACAAVLGLAACPKKDADKTEKEKPAAKVEDKEAKPEAKNEAKPDDADLPAECKDYRAAIEKAASCDKLGAQKDALKNAFDTASAAWGKLDAAGKKALGDGCKAGADAVKQAVSAACP
jgi:hypothetical protein